MTFTTPCFVYVPSDNERKELIEWLKSIGYNIADNLWGEYVVVNRDEAYCPLAVYNYALINCGLDTHLFKALAAMNDENCLEQWFTDGQNWGLCKDKYWAVQVAEWDVEGNDDMLEMAISTQCRKATAEEIVEYFKKRDK